MNKPTDWHPAILSTLLSAFVAIGSVTYFGGELNGDVEYLKGEVKKLIEADASLNEDLKEMSEDLKKMGLQDF